MGSGATQHGYAVENKVIEGHGKPALQVCTREGYAVENKVIEGHSRDVSMQVQLM